MQGWFNIYKLINILHIDRMKGNNMIIKINTERIFDKIQHIFMIKIFKLGIEGNYFNIIKSTLIRKPTANTTLNADSLRSFSARSGRLAKGASFWLLLFNLVLDNFEGFKTAVEEVTADVAEKTARELEI